MLTELKNIILSLFKLHGLAVFSYPFLKDMITEVVKALDKCDSIRIHKIDKSIVFLFTCVDNSYTVTVDVYEMDV